MSIGRLFIGGMLAFGVVVGFALLRFPEQLSLLPVAAFMVPLIVSFIVDIVVMPLSRQGRVEPLTMEQRFLGVIGAAIIATGIAEFGK